MSWMMMSAAQVQPAPEAGFSFREMVGWLPTDPASLFAIGLVVGSAALVLWAGRPKGDRGDRPA